LVYFSLCWYIVPRKIWQPCLKIGKEFNFLPLKWFSATENQKHKVDNLLIGAKGFRFDDISKKNFRYKSDISDKTIFRNFGIEKRLFIFFLCFSSLIEYIPELGCRMVCFQTKITNLGTFCRVLRWKMLVYFMAIWSIL
jgi:hypothetical protein